MADMYDDFKEFVAKALEEIKKKNGDQFDAWLGATSVALGATTTSAILPRLGLGSAIGASFLATPLIPVVGGALAGGAAYLMAKYLSKAKTEQGRKITERIESAKILYHDYLVRYSEGDIDYERKIVLIDRLFNKLISGKELI